MKKINVQIITAAVLAIGGLILLFCGTYIDPQGEISESLLIGFGEVATFSGALFGIDAAYSKKLWDITNLLESRKSKGTPKISRFFGEAPVKVKSRKKSEEHSAVSNTGTPEVQESIKNT